jgi:hypothetical protein
VSVVDFPPLKDTVPVLACMHCDGDDFYLRDDGGIFCSGCHTLYAAVRWFFLDGTPLPGA